MESPPTKIQTMELVERCWLNRCAPKWQRVHLDNRKGERCSYWQNDRN